MTAAELIKFRDAVAEKVERQYPCVDYIHSVIVNAIETQSKILGWAWYVDGPRPIESNKENAT